ncbi:hypothetical protein ABZ299_03720 [Streptomyces sp. NPDC006184]|uniref:hypothetical protein n=1 Tax=Streptomyces sp. NPDC006184 TaxID=3155455 RepID=UPI0033BDD11F
MAPVGTQTGQADPDAWYAAADSNVPIVTLASVGRRAMVGAGSVRLIRAEEPWTAA